MGSATVAERVRSAVTQASVGTFVTSRDVLDELPVGSRPAVDAALSRLAEAGELFRVRPGIYYRGKSTRYGPTRPEPLAVAYAVCKERGYDSGVGPSGYSAARRLGLTTQVPAREEVAVPGRAPADLPAVHFTARAGAARAGLKDDEVAVLEVLREWPRFSERGWDALCEAVAELAASRRVRLDVLLKAARRERHSAARARVETLAATLSAT